MQKLQHLMLVETSARANLLTEIQSKSSATANNYRSSTTSAKSNSVTSKYSTNPSSRYSSSSILSTTTLASISISASVNAQKQNQFASNTSEFTSSSFANFNNENNIIDQKLSAVTPTTKPTQYTGVTRAIFDVISWFSLG
jgi:hypothetical protein